MSRYLLPPGIYLDGNSLGPMPGGLRAELSAELDRWESLGVRAWETWFSLAESLSPQLAGLVGAESDEVIATGSISANLHALLATFYLPEGERRDIVAAACEFPSDLYALSAWCQRLGGKLRLIPARHELLEEEDIWACLDERVALLWLPTVLYRSGQLLEVGRWTAEAHRVGALAGWDAAHSVGALPHAFHAQEVDFAVWCHYKYVAAGPGAPAGLFVHRKHAGALPGLPGWWGSDKASQFAMATPMSPAAGAGRFQQGTPSVLALAALRAALRVLAQVDLAEVRASSLRLTSLLIDLIDRYLPECALITPRDPERRGGHVTLRHSRARVLGEQLREDGVIPDVRPPDLLRLAPFPLQTEPAELERAVLAIRSRLDRAEWDRPELSQVP